MGSFSVIKDYLETIMLMLLPIAGMMLLFYSAYQLWRDLRQSDKKKVKQRLREQKVKQRAQKEQEKRSIVREVPGQKKLYEKMLEKVSITKKVQIWANQANLQISGSKLLMNLILGSSVTLGLGLLIGIKLWIVLTLTASILLLPVYTVRFLANRRMKKLVNQLPDVFELMSQSLRAGHALASSIQLVGQQLPDPAGSEFALIFHEQNLGIKIEESLKHFAGRTDQLDVRFFVTAVLIQRQTGGDLGEILDKIGSVIRDRIKIMGQVKALTAEGRMSGWVLSALPFAVFGLAWMLNPDYANILLYEKQGQILLGSAAFFQVIGMLMIKKIVNIKI